MNYKAGFTYVTWKLFDSLRLHKVKRVTGTEWATHVIEDRVTTFNNVIENYDDNAQI